MFDASACSHYLPGAREAMDGMAPPAARRERMTTSEFERPEARLCVGVRGGPALDVIQADRRDEA